MPACTLLRIGIDDFSLGSESVASFGELTGTILLPGRRALGPLRRLHMSKGAVLIVEMVC